jgi:uroporphyrinogen III methyltransferase / synthase
MPADSSPGRVYLVGAGPGDPGLLTLRAAELLRDTEVLLYDALASDAIVALAPAHCERVFVGKRAGRHAMEQAEIEALLIAKAGRGLRVVRLKGGDPFVFGRGGEEAQALRAAGIPFEVVPGISSALAAPAYAGIPVTHREHNASFTVLTGHEDPSKGASTVDWAKLAGPHRTLVLLMATENLRRIAQQLIAQGVPDRTPAAVIQDGTRPSQRTAAGTLATIADKVAELGIGAPAVAVIGEVVSLREELRWFDAGPLFGKRVLVTRAGHQADAFAWALLSRGAEPILAPTIAIVPPDDAGSADRAIEQLASYAWIVFTSQNGVDAFFAHLGVRDADARAIGRARVAAIGERTAEVLRSYGVRADLVPSEFVSEEIGRALIERSQSGDRILLFRAQEARDVLPQMLEDAKLRVTVAAAYKAVAATDPAFAQKVARADVLTFTSASTVRSFSSLLGGDAQAASAASGKLTACIGPVTAHAASQVGLEVDVVAHVYTTAGLLFALEAHFARR